MDFYILFSLGLARFSLLGHIGTLGVPDHMISLEGAIVGNCSGKQALAPPPLPTCQVLTRVSRQPAAEDTAETRSKDRCTGLPAKTKAPDKRYGHGLRSTRLRESHLLCATSSFWRRNYSAPWQEDMTHTDHGKRRQNSQAVQSQLRHWASVSLSEEGWGFLTLKAEYVWSLSQLQHWPSSRKIEGPMVMRNLSGPARVPVTHGQTVVMGE